MIPIRRITISVSLLVLFGPQPAPGSPTTWDEDPIFLLTLRSRGTLCEPEEACVDRVCASDGATACLRTTDCPRCLSVENRDVAMCRPVSLGENQTACNWSLFFDGTRAGLNAPIRALEILPDGSLLMRTAAHNAIPDISGASRRDIVRFVPTDAAGRPGGRELPYVHGRWSVFFDGRAVAINSDTQLMDGIAVLSDSCRDVNGDGRIDDQECDILFSPLIGGSLGNLKISTEDIIRCRPTVLSPGGTVEACEFAHFYDSSEVNDSDPNDGISEKNAGSWSSGGNSAFAVTAFDPTRFHAAVWFSAGYASTLPTHQPSRDLLLNLGHVGPRGWCQGDVERPCLSASDCPLGGGCGHIANPDTATAASALVLDGSDVLGAEMIAAVAIVFDRDGDGVPDPLDNCPNESNPKVCSDSGEPCETAGDCAAEALCRQPDADGDGIGDPCDPCDGRFVAACACGDFVTNAPVEQCDLGAPEVGGQNGLESSPCTADCRLVGRCTRSGQRCSRPEECAQFASGEGCCGNGVVDVAASIAPHEADEACDDANAIDDDACSNSCRPVGDPLPLPQECHGLLGPRVVPTFVRSMRFENQRRRVPIAEIRDRYSEWNIRGEFSLANAILFDPDSQAVEVILSQGAGFCDGGVREGTRCESADDCPQARCDTTLYRAAVPAGTFTQAGRQQNRPRWTFSDRHGAFPGAPAWTKGRFAQRLATIRRPLNQVRFMMQGRGDRLDPPFTWHIDPTAMDGPPTRVRQTIRVGELCTTQVLTCETRRLGKTLQCFSQVDP